MSNTTAVDKTSQGQDTSESTQQVMDQRRPYNGNEDILDNIPLESLPVQHDQSPSENDNEVDQIPDGGVRAWLVVLGGFLGFSTGYGMLNSWGTFQAYYALTWENESIANISWIGSLQPGLLFLLGCIFGPAFDRFGARPLMIAGSLFYVLSFILASFSRRLWHYLLTQGVLLGISNGLLFYGANGAIAGWFDKHRGLALGLAACGSSIGGICWPLLIDKLLYSVGLQWTHRIMAFISLPILTAACFFVKERKTPATENNSEGFARWMEMAKSTLLRTDFLFMGLSLFLVFLGIMIPFNYIPLWAVFNGTTMTKANVYLSICYSGSVVGRIASGWLADRLGHFNILAISCCLAGVVTTAWIQMDTDESMGAFAFLYGLFSSASAPLVPACVTEISSDMSTVGLRLSAVMAMCSVSTVGGGPAAGTLFDKAKHGYVGYLAVFLFSGIATLTGGIVLFVVGLVWVPVNRLFGRRASLR